MKSQFWGILCLVGVWGWIGCAAGLIVQGFPARGRFAGRPALYWGSALVLCFALWVTAMANA